MVHLCLAFQPLLQNRCTLVVDTPPRHVDGFDLGRGGGFYRVEIAFADLEIGLDHLTERSKA
jgi:hypothetical protein